MPIVTNGGAGSNRGFTLVEMSIVLVIIGLIIGGILKGQEIIQSARQKSVINQVNAIKAAANTYFDRYRGFPGDDPTGSATDANILNGDGDGFVGVEQTSTSTIISVAADGSGDDENYVFFNALMTTNLLNGGQATASTVTDLTGSGFGKRAIPAAPITGAGMEVVYGTASGTGAGHNKTGHWIRLQRGLTAATDSVSPRTMASMDAQMDDGLPGAGAVRANSDATGATTCDNAGAYATGDEIACVGLFEQ